MKQKLTPREIENAANRFLRRKGFDPETAEPLGDERVGQNRFEHTQVSLVGITVPQSRRTEVQRINRFAALARAI